MTEDKASSSHVVVPIPTSLEEGVASNIVFKHSLLFLIVNSAALTRFVLIFFSFSSRGVGAPCDEER